MLYLAKWSISYDQDVATMQANSTVYRGTILALSGAVLAITVYYLGYTRYLDGPYDQKRTNLQRRNAVRQRNRGWRHEHSPRPIEVNLVDDALSRLKERERLGEGYGYYTNNFYTRGLPATVPPLSLLPSNLESIFVHIRAFHNLPENILAQIKGHVQRLFLLNFLSAELPAGHIIGDDHVKISTALQGTIPAEVIEDFVVSFDSGEADMPMHVHFEDNEDEIGEDENQVSELTTASPLAHQLRDNGSRSIQSRGQDVLDLLYKIGQEQAQISGYKHRGVVCDSCNTTPIAGVRYRCANCYDYDLCQSCEAQDVHDGTHVFYKIRVPLPTRNRAVVKQPRWYPGSPQDFDYINIPVELRDTLLETTGLDRQALDAYYDHFKCIAGHPWSDDPSRVRMAIDRKNFDQYFTTSSVGYSSASLIYDRIFSFYDSNSDGLIGFAEFATALGELANNTTRDARVRRAFKAFDLDEDGYVNRRDFLHMLRAYYALSQDQIQESVRARDDLVLAEEVFQNTVRGNYPISAAFEGSIFPSHRSRHGEGKHLASTQDLELDDENEGVLAPGRERVMTRMDVLTHIIGHKRSGKVTNGYDEPVLPMSGSVTSSDDDRRSQTNDQDDIIRERRLRRGFYDSMVSSDDGDVNSSAADDTSNDSRQVVSEDKLWGKFEFSGPPQELGVDIMYEAVQEAFNDLLDLFFKDKEDRVMEARASKNDRERWRHMLDEYEGQLEQPQPARIGPDMSTEQAGQSARSTLPPWQNMPEDSSIRESQLRESGGPSRADLQRWHEHALIERETEERGGPARLNLEEFKRTLHVDSWRGTTGASDEVYFWDARADLGRFSFLSSWLEMASF